MKKKILFMASLVGAMMLTACSSEDNSTEQGGQVDVAKGITFQFSEEAFVPGVIGDKETQGTRVGMQPQSVDLGNGLVAEMSIEPDTEGTPQTRAPQPMSDGHYKIYAVDANNVRHNGLSGTITAGVFTPDVAGQRWQLKSGETYTFVCINDAVTDNGTSLTVSYTAQNAMIGVTQHTVSATTDKDVVAFEMKHQQPRVRYQITSYTAPCVGAKIYFVSDSGPDWGTENFNLKGQSTGLGNNGFLNGDDIPMTSTATVEYSPYVKAHKVSTPYQYYAEGSNLRYIQYFSFNGTLHGKDLATKTTAGSTLRNRISSMTNAAATIHKNHSYVVNIKLKSKDPLLLFEDGTVGYFGDKGTRTPIAMVVKEKNTSEDGLAMALKDDGQQYPAAEMNDQYYDYHISGDGGQVDNMKGYDLTWTTNYYRSGLSYTLPPAEQLVSYAPSKKEFPAYYAAAHYNPGVLVTGTNVGKWFLPSSGQWIMAAERFGGLSRKPTGWFDVVTWNGTQAQASFTQVGGTLPLSTPAYGGTILPYAYYVMSGTGMYQPVFVQLKAADITWTLDSFVTIQSGYARPFVYF